MEMNLGLLGQGENSGPFSIESGLPKCQFFLSLLVVVAMTHPLLLRMDGRTHGNWASLSTSEMMELFEPLLKEEEEKGLVLKYHDTRALAPLYFPVFWDGVPPERLVEQSLRDTFQIMWTGQSSPLPPGSNETPFLLFCVARQLKSLMNHQMPPWTGGEGTNMSYMPTVAQEAVLALFNSFALSSRPQKGVLSGYKLSDTHFAALTVAMASECSGLSEILRSFQAAITRDCGEDIWKQCLAALHHLVLRNGQLSAHRSLSTPNKGEATLPELPRLFQLGQLASLNVSSSGDQVKDSLTRALLECTATMAQIMGRSDGPPSGECVVLGLDLTRSKTPPRFTVVEETKGMDLMDVRAGNECLFVLDVNGALWARGSCEGGRLGLRTKTNQSAFDRLVLKVPIESFDASRFGGGHGIAIDKEGSLWTWGHGEKGQLGHGQVQSIYLPKRIISLDKYRFVQVACGDSHSLALSESGHAFSWGDDGLQREKPALSPVLVGGIERISGVFAGAHHSFALSEGSEGLEGAVWGWGSNSHSQLCSTSHSQVSSPKALLKGHNIRQMAGGATYSLALTRKGEVFFFGTLNGMKRPEPSQVNGLDLVPIGHIAAGPEECILISQHLDVYIWNPFGAEEPIRELNALELPAKGVQQASLSKDTAILTTLSSRPRKPTNPLLSKELSFSSPHLNEFLGNCLSMWGKDGGLQLQTQIALLAVVRVTLSLSKVSGTAIDSQMQLLIRKLISFLLLQRNIDHQSNLICKCIMRESWILIWSDLPSRVALVTELLLLCAKADLTKVALELLSQVTESLIHSHQFASHLGIYGPPTSSGSSDILRIFESLLEGIHRHLLSCASDSPAHFLVQLLSYLITRLIGTVAGFIEDHPLESICINVVTSMTRQVIEIINLDDDDFPDPNNITELVETWHNTILALHLVRRKVLSLLRAQVIEVMTLAAKEGPQKRVGIANLAASLLGEMHSRSLVPQYDPDGDETRALMSSLLFSHGMETRTDLCERDVSLRQFSQAGESMNRSYSCIEAFAHQQLLLSSSADVHQPLRRLVSSLIAAMAKACGVEKKLFNLERMGMSTVAGSKALQHIIQQAYIARGAVLHQMSHELDEMAEHTEVENEEELIDEEAQITRECGILEALVKPLIDRAHFLIEYVRPAIVEESEFKFLSSSPISTVSGFIHSRKKVRGQVTPPSPKGEEEDFSFLRSSAPGGGHRLIHVSGPSDDLATPPLMSPLRAAKQRLESFQHIERDANISEQDKVINQAIAFIRGSQDLKALSDAAKLHFRREHQVAEALNELADELVSVNEAGLPYSVGCVLLQASTGQLGLINSFHLDETIIKEEEVIQSVRKLFNVLSEIFASLQYDTRDSNLSTYYALAIVQMISFLSGAFKLSPPVVFFDACLSLEDASKGQLTLPDVERQIFSSVTASTNDSEAPVERIMELIHFTLTQSLIKGRSLSNCTNFLQIISGVTSVRKILSSPLWVDLLFRLVASWDLSAQFNCIQLLRHSLPEISGDISDWKYMRSITENLYHLLEDEDLNHLVDLPLRMGGADDILSISEELEPIITIKWPAGSPLGSFKGQGIHVYLPRDYFQFTSFIFKFEILKWPAGTSLLMNVGANSFQIHDIHQAEGSFVTIVLQPFLKFENHGNLTVQVGTNGKLITHEFSSTFQVIFMAACINEPRTDQENSVQFRYLTPKASNFLPSCGLLNSGAVVQAASQVLRDLHYLSQWKPFIDNHIHRVFLNSLVGENAKEVLGVARMIGGLYDGCYCGGLVDTPDGLGTVQVIDVFLKPQLLALVPGFDPSMVSDFINLPFWQVEPAHNHDVQVSHLPLSADAFRSLLGNVDCPTESTSWQDGLRCISILKAVSKCVSSLSGRTFLLKVFQSDPHLQDKLLTIANLPERLKLVWSRELLEEAIFNTIGFLKENSYFGDANEPTQDNIPRLEKQSAPHASHSPEINWKRLINKIESQKVIARPLNDFQKKTRRVHAESTDVLELYKGAESSCRKSKENLIRLLQEELLSVFARRIIRKLTCDLRWKTTSPHLVMKINAILSLIQRNEMRRKLPSEQVNRDYLAILSQLVASQPEAAAVIEMRTKKLIQDIACKAVDYGSSASWFCSVSKTLHPTVISDIADMSLVVFCDAEEIDDNRYAAGRILSRLLWDFGAKIIHNSKQLCRHLQKLFEVQNRSDATMETTLVSPIMVHTHSICLQLKGELLNSAASIDPCQDSLHCLSQLIEMSRSLTEGSVVPSTFVELSVAISQQKLSTVLQESLQDHQLCRNNALWTTAMDQALMDWHRSWKKGWREPKRVYLWGRGDEGQFGEGKSSLTPKSSRDFNLNALKQIVAGKDCSFVLYNDGKLFATGQNSLGALGLGDVQQRYTLSEVKFPLEMNVAVTFISTSVFDDADISSRKFRLNSPSHTASQQVFSVAIDQKNQVWSWGAGQHGQLGRDEMLSMVPTLIPCLSSLRVKLVSCGANHCGAVTQNGEVLTWGHAPLLGRETTEGHVPGFVLLSNSRDSRALSIACGLDHTLVLTKTKVWAWGQNRSGQLGLGHTSDVSHPLECHIPGGKVAAQVAVGEEWSAIRCESGELLVFGTNRFGTLGLADYKTQSNEPIEVPVIPPVAEISCGPRFILALTECQKVFCWGENADCELGLGHRQKCHSPTEMEVPSDVTLKSIIAGSNHSILVGEIRSGTLPVEVPQKYSILGKIPESQLRARAHLLREFSRLFITLHATIPRLFDPFTVSFGLEKHIWRIQGHTLHESFRKNWVPNPSTGSGPTILFKRRSADGKTKPPPIFEQVYQFVQHTMNSYDDLRPSRAWQVTFEGENYGDVGGPFRESLSTICSELQGLKLSRKVVEATANRASKSGPNQEAIMPAPYSGAPGQLQLKERLRFLGLLIAVGLRSMTPLSLQFPLLFWKSFLGHPLDEEDILEIDEAFYQRHLFLRNLDDSFDAEDFAELPLEDFSPIIKADHQKVALTFSTRHEYVAAAFDQMMNRWKESMIIIRRGCNDLLPFFAIELFSPRDLETLVCGSPHMDLNVLRACVVYNGYQKESKQIAWLWQILEEMNDEQREQFLRFVWARPRLPESADQVNDTFKIQKAPGGDLPLPRASTCFFLLYLPAYSTKEVMSSKMHYAIRFCGVIGPLDTRQ